MDPLPDLQPTRALLPSLREIAETDIPKKLAQGNRNQVVLAAAHLYGRGLKRKEIAYHMAQWLRPESFEENPTHPDSLKSIRTKLRRWEHNRDFRDMVYDIAIADLDLELPDILKGIARKGRQGRVDAARLALEVTGRHNPKGEQAPTTVVVQIANVPRPNAS